MPLFYLRRLTGRERTDRANRHLARYLAFVAGAANAGGFLAVRQYTSHMTGIISAMSDNLALGQRALVWKGAGGGARLPRRCFCDDSVGALGARPEAGERVCASAAAGGRAAGDLWRDQPNGDGGERLFGTVLLLCFTMGLQNAIITKLSHAVIRTTHLTGMVTDIGIALGRIVLSGRQPSDKQAAETRAELAKIRLLGSLIALFFLGGVTGALGFKQLGFWFTLPLAGVLVLLAVMPLLDDVRRMGGRKTLNSGA